MLDSIWEQDTVELLRDAERERHRAEQDIVDANYRLAAREQEFAAIRLTIDAYRAKHNLPNEPIPDSATDSTYARLGPSAMVEQWAASHEGVVVIKVAARELIHLFPNYSAAYHSLRATVSRKRHFRKAGPGVYQRMNGAQLAIATPANIARVVEDSGRMTVLNT